MSHSATKPTAFERVHEAIAIGEQAGVPVQSRRKVVRRGLWQVCRDVKMIETRAYAAVDVSADCYPYNSWHSKSPYSAHKRLTIPRA